MAFSLPSSVSGFSVLPVAYSSSVTHVLYARSHAGPKTSEDVHLPTGRTLFLVNVPPDATERELILFFKHAGTVERVLFHRDSVKEGGIEDSSEDEDMVDADDVENDSGKEDRPRKKRKTTLEGKESAPKVTPLPSSPLRILRLSGRSAHVVFLDASSLARALSTPSKPRPWPASEDPSGLTRYSELYNLQRPPLDAVRDHADTYMEWYEYDQAKAKQKTKYRKGEAIVDEDGFTLVTRGGAYGKTLGGGVGVASKIFQQSGQTSNRRRKKEKEKEDFYAFQKAEKQRNGDSSARLTSSFAHACTEIMDLRQKWEVDKANIEKLKQSRKFKPY